MLTIDEEKFLMDLNTYYNMEIELTDIRKPNFKDGKAIGMSNIIGQVRTLLEEYKEKSKGE